MNKNLKTGLYIFGGLALATGIFFAVRAMIGDDENDLTRSEREELERLKQKEMDGNLSEKERELLKVLLDEYDPGPDDVPLGSDSCGKIIGNNSGGRFGCKEVAQIQTAINQKHNNNTQEYVGGFQSTYCCTDSDDKKLVVDGVMGPNTARAVKKYYGTCCKCVCDWSLLCVNYTCNCLDCSINKATLSKITSGADISDKKLCSEGYTKACSGTTSSFSGYSNFTLSNKEQLRGTPGLEWRDQQGPLGDFYPGRYDFTNDNPPLSNLEHSYGVGKGFGFAGGQSNGNEYISYGNSEEDWTEFEAPTQTLNEFYDDVP